MDKDFEMWAEKRGVWPRLTHEEIWMAGATNIEIVTAQRDWLLAALWKYANLINNRGVHVMLDEIGHEDCEACGGTGRVFEGELCAFGSPQVRAIKEL